MTITFVIARKRVRHGIYRVAVRLRARGVVIIFSSRMARYTVTCTVSARSYGMLRAFVYHCPSTYLHFCMRAKLCNVYIQDTVTTLRYEHTEILNLILLYVLS